jgi:hypothetical protein
VDAGVISEFEAPGKPDAPEGNGDSYQPTEEEQDTLKLVEKLFTRSKKWRSAYDKNWIDNYKQFRGQQWETQRPAYRHSEVINMIFQAIQGSVPIITDSRPKFEYLPRDPSDMEFAELMNMIAEADWAQNNWLIPVTETVYDAHIYGHGFGGFEYDPKGKKGESDIVHDSIDPFSVYPDPNSRDINKKSKYLILAEPVDLECLRDEYPEMGRFVRADVMDVTRGEKSDLEPFYQLRIPIDETQSLRDSAGSVEGILDQKALKKTCYLLDDSTYNEETTNEAGEPLKIEKKRFPNGRKIVIAGGVVLEDGPLPYEDKKFPAARLVNYLLPREFWGMSDVEQLKSPQKIFNKLISFALDVLTLMGNPVWVVDFDSGVDTDNLINKPGLVVEKARGSEVSRQEGVQLQPYVLQLIDRMRDWFDGVSGSTDVSRGVQPGGVTAAAAISDLQEAAQTRIRLKTRFLDAYLQDLGQMYLSRVLQYRDTPTIVRLTNNQNAAQYFKFHIQQQVDPVTGQPVVDERGNPVRMAVVQDMTEGGVNGLRQIQIKNNLDVRVSTGTSLPFLKAQKSNEAKDLFDRGLIDQEEVLKTLDWPNYQSVMGRMQKVAMAQQQAEQEAAMAAEQAKTEGALALKSTPAAPEPMPPMLPSSAPL